VIEVMPLEEGIVVARGAVHQADEDRGRLHRAAA
jgi:hypothetical protein